MEQLQFIVDTDTTPAAKRSPDLKAYRVPKYTIKLVREATIPVYPPQESIRQPSQLYQVAAEMLKDLDREHLIVIMLDTKNKIIGANVVAMGGISSAYLDIKSVFKPALLCNAAGIALAHNHPSGDTTPSPEDIHATNLVIDACKIFDICFTDHLILGDSDHGGPMSYTSLRERGLLSI